MAALAVSASALPAAASAAPSPNDLEVVVTRSEVTKPGFPATVTVRVHNKGTEAWTRESSDAARHLFVNWRGGWGGGDFLRGRSAYGWDCTDYTDAQECELEHTIPAGGYSLPIEFDVLPQVRGDLDATFLINARGEVSTEGPAPAGRAISSFDIPSYTGAPLTGETTEGGHIGELDWDPDGADEVNRKPLATASASTQSVTGDETFTVGLEVGAAANVSTGPSALQDVTQRNPDLKASRSFNGPAATFPTPELEFTIPAEAELVKIVAYAPHHENITFPIASATRSARALDPDQHVDEIEIPASMIYPIGEGRFGINFDGYQYDSLTGEFVKVEQAGFDALQRFLPGNTFRFVITAKLKGTATEATFGIDAFADGEITWPVDEAARSGRSAGRALTPTFQGAYATHAEVTVRRAVVVPTPTPTATPTPTPTATPTATPAPTPVPTPVPDQGGVLSAQAAPRLVGRATFAVPTIRVGRTTTVKVTVTNRGNAASTSGNVCARLSSHVVILSVPKGVTVKGSVICAKRGAIGVGKTITAASGIVVRGVVATPRATVRDGGDDGVAVTGDTLRILNQLAQRGGGVTG